MFGKGKRNPSANDRFIMAAGRKAGNLPDRAHGGPSGMGKSEAASRHHDPKASAPTVTIKKGQQPVNAVASLAPRTINRSQVRFPATTKAGKFPHVQGGRKG